MQIMSLFEMFKLWVSHFFRADFHPFYRRNFRKSCSCPSMQAQCPYCVDVFFLKVISSCFKMFQFPFFGFDKIQILFALNSKKNLTSIYYHIDLLQMFSSFIGLFICHDGKTIPSKDL